MPPPLLAFTAVSRRQYEDILWSVDRWAAVLGFSVAAPLLFVFRPYTFAVLLLSFVLMAGASFLSRRLQERCRGVQELVDAGSGSEMELQSSLARLRGLVILVKGAAICLAGVVAASAVLSVFLWVK